MFTTNLKELRLSYNLTQKELAEELGTSQQSYMKWETGKTSPTLKTIQKIAQFFNVPISKLTSDNILQIEDILNAYHIDYLEQELSDKERELFQDYVFSFIKDKLNYLSYTTTTKRITLKNGKHIYKSNNQSNAQINNSQNKE